MNNVMKSVDEIRGGKYTVYVIVMLAHDNTTAPFDNKAYLPSHLEYPCKAIARTSTKRDGKIIPQVLLGFERLIVDTPDVNLAGKY